MFEVVETGITQDKMMFIGILDNDCKEVFAAMAKKQGECAYKRRTDEN